jgi:hypothetical protein
MVHTEYLRQDRRDSNDRIKDPGQNSIDRKGRRRTRKTGQRRQNCTDRRE